MVETSFSGVGWQHWNQEQGKFNFVNDRVVVQWVEIGGRERLWGVKVGRVDD